MDMQECTHCGKEAQKTLSTYYAVCDLNWNVEGPLVYADDDSGMVPVCLECLDKFYENSACAMLKEVES